MARRGRRKKFKFKMNIRPDTVRSIISLSMILAALLSLVSFFAPHYTINEKIQDILRGLFGLPSVLVPFLMAGVGLVFLDSLKHKLKEPRIVIGLVALLLSLSGLFHIFISDENAEKFANAGKGGGLVGYKISELLENTVSIYGGVVVLLIAVVVALIVVSDISLDRLMEFVSSKSEGLNLPGFLSFGKKKEDESNVEVSTGMDVSAHSDPEKSESDHDDDDASDIDAGFEVIPTMSEPQAGADVPLSAISSKSPSGMPTLPYADKVWEYPPYDLLDEPKFTEIDSGDTAERAKIIINTLKSFNIDVSVVDIKCGPSVTQYALKAESGVKVSKIAGLHNDLAMALASPTGSVRIEAPIPGKSLIGIEVPNNKRALVDFKSLVTSEPMKGLKSKLGIVLGKDVGGKVYTYDIAKMPHLLIAGATGSGKSVFIHNIIFSILFRATPQEVKFILVDPKRVELQHYQNMPHLMTPVVTDMEKAASVFRWAVTEMERRYKLFESAKARNIEVYNEKSGFQALPYIVIVVDELAEIMVMDPAGVEKSIIRIAQLARATGIHLVLAVQRPSTNIITGLIKANIPCRVAFNVTSQIDSRVIIDQPGAEKLLGKGDMLFVPPDAAKPFRLQGAWVADKEISEVVGYLINQGIEPEYKEEVFEMYESSKSSASSWGGDVDDLFDEAVETVSIAGKASASLLQRKLSIGYARAARILDELEEKGVVGPAQGSKPRSVLIDAGASAGFDMREHESKAYNELDSIGMEPSDEEMEDEEDSLQEL